MKMYYGPRTVIINEPLNNKENIMEKLQTFEAPDAIMSIRNKAAEFVANHYKEWEKKLKTQAQKEESIPPAPDWFEEKGEE